MMFECGHDLFINNLNGGIISSYFIGIGDKNKGFFLGIANNRILFTDPFKRYIWFIFDFVGYDSVVIT